MKKFGVTWNPPGRGRFVDANNFLYPFARPSGGGFPFLRPTRGGGGAQGRAPRRPGMKRSPAAILAKRPDLVRELSMYYFSVLAIAKFGLQVVPLPPDLLTASQEFRQAYGLLVNDSLVAMHMRQAGLSFLASADAAFDRG